MSDQSLAPHFTGDICVDAARLQRLASAIADTVGALPAKPGRTLIQQHALAEALSSGRAARNGFMSLHADAVYDAATDRRRRHLRLGKLAHALGDGFPGLMPTRAQIDADSKRIQAHKDGFEIDQAIVFGALLRSPVTGAHLIDAMLLPAPASAAALTEFRRTGLLKLDSVTLHRRGNVAHLTIHNEHCLNAEDNKLVADMEIAIDVATLDTGVRVGVVRGAPMTLPRYRGRRVFSAGINLTDLRNGAISFLDFMLGREMGLVNKLLHGVLVEPENSIWTQRTRQRPWIAAVDAFAIGGGMQLLLVFDRVVAAADAYFALPAAQEGIVPGLAGLRLGRFAGARLARRIILSGHRIKATDEEASLFCDDVVAPEDMDNAVEQAAAELSAPAVVANRRMLSLAEEDLGHLRKYLAEFAIIQSERLYAKDVLDRVERRWAQRMPKK